MNEQKNLMTAIILVVGILFGFHYFYERPKAIEEDAHRREQIAQKAEQEELAKAQSAQTPQPKSEGAAPSAASGSTHGLLPLPPSAMDHQILQREELISNAATRVAIQTPTLTGSINLKGGLIDDLTLRQYRTDVASNSPHIVLLSPKGTKEGYLGATGWKQADQGSHAYELPDHNTLWTVEGTGSTTHAASTTLTPETPVTLTFTNAQGIVFKRVISIDQNYMFHVEDSVQNNSDAPISMQHIAMIERHDIPVSAQSGFILHEGPIGVINSKLYEVDYDDMTFSPKMNQQRFEKAQKSWVGFTDKYWLTALVPNPKDSVAIKFLGDDEAKLYYTVVEAAVDMLQPSQSASHTMHFYAGAKILELLDAYEAQIGFDKFDLAVDFGWFYFLTKPMLGFLQFLHKHIGNFGLGILILTVLMKALFFPLANKSYRSMSRMRAFAPHIEALKAKYGDDRMKLNQAMMELYQKHKINPVSGCLPMLIQAPVFFCLYKVLYVSLDMRQAPFYGWIQDLSQPDPTSFINLFGLLPFDPPSFLHIGAWPLIMGATMFLQQKMNPQPADKTQAMMFLIMPLFMTFLFATFPAGLVIYWAWSNVLGILQQYMIMRLEDKRMKKVKA